MTDSPDVYEQHCQRLHADEATPDEGTPDGDGGFFRTLPSGEVEWRPADQDWPPPSSASASAAPARSRRGC